MQNGTQYTYNSQVLMLHSALSESYRQQRMWHSRFPPLAAYRIRFWWPRVRSGFIRGLFGFRSAPFRTKIFRAQKLEISKIFDLCGRRRRGGGSPAAVPSTAARRAPAAAATAAPIENFCEKLSAQVVS